jgi:hypothetical protein
MTATRETNHDYGDHRLTGCPHPEALVPTTADAAHAAAAVAAAVPSARTTTAGAHPATALPDDTMV